MKSITKTKGKMVISLKKKVKGKMVVFILIENIYWEKSMFNFCWNKFAQFLRDNGY